MLLHKRNLNQRWSISPRLWIHLSIEWQQRTQNINDHTNARYLIIVGTWPACVFSTITIQTWYFNHNRHIIEICRYCLLITLNTLTIAILFYLICWFCRNADRMCMVFVSCVLASKETWHWVKLVYAFLSWWFKWQVFFVK